MQIGLVLKPGPQEPWTPYRMTAALVEAGIPAEAISIYPGGADVGAAVLAACQRSMIFGGEATVERYKGNPRVQAHGPGFSKILLGDDVVDHWEKYLDLMVDSIYLEQRPRLHQLLGRVGLAAHARDRRRPWPSGWARSKSSRPTIPQAGAGGVHRAGRGGGGVEIDRGRSARRRGRAHDGRVRPAAGRDGALRLPAADDHPLQVAAGGRSPARNSCSRSPRSSNVRRSG